MFVLNQDIFTEQKGRAVCDDGVMWVTAMQRSALQIQKQKKRKKKTSKKYVQCWYGGVFSNVWNKYSLHFFL